MAMSILASGAISANEAIDFVKEQNIQSFIFGASSENHIKETIKMINKK